MFLSNRRTTEAFHPCGCTNKRVKRAAARHHGRRYNTLARAHNMRRAATISFSHLSHPFTNLPTGLVPPRQSVLPLPSRAAPLAPSPAPYPCTSYASCDMPHVIWLL